MRCIVGRGQAYIQSQCCSLLLQTMHIKELVLWHWCRDTLAAVWYDRIHVEHHCIVICQIETQIKTTMFAQKKSGRFVQNSIKKP